MWSQISCLYFYLIFGVYCFVLPSTSSAQQRKMKFCSTKDLRILASEISNNKNFNNREFKDLVKPLLIPRMPDTEGNTLVQNVRFIFCYRAPDKYIKDHYRALNWHIEEDQFQDSTPYGKKTFTNIIVTMEPEIKNKLVLACHFDSKNLSDSQGYFIGATDSAVPCAIMMDIAKKLDCGLLQKKENRKRSLFEDVTLQMMFFDGEEAYQTWTDTDSLYGSRHLARKLKTEYDRYFPSINKLDNIELFVLLDLIGTKDITFQNFFMATEKYFNWMQKTDDNFKADDIAVEYRLNMLECDNCWKQFGICGVFEDTLATKNFLNPKGLQKKRFLFSRHAPWGSVEDDHKPFLRERRGLPVLHLISSPFPTVWHRMSDNEASIDYDVTDNVNRILRVFVSSYLGLPAVSCRH